MLELNTDNMVVALGGITTALITIALLLKKFFNIWNSTGTENSLISLLHTELNRLSSHNSKLMLELEKLQNEVIKLSGEMYKLTQENQNLHGEVTQLTHEVSRLHSLIRLYQNDPSIL